MALESVVALEEALKPSPCDLRGKIALTDGDLQAAVRYGRDAVTLATNLRPCGR